mgnify:CR=1 FL=1
MQRIKLFGIIAVLVLVIGACGGDDTDTPAQGGDNETTAPEVVEADPALIEGDMTTIRNVMWHYVGLVRTAENPADDVPQYPYLLSDQVLLFQALRGAGICGEIIALGGFFAGQERLAQPVGDHLEAHVGLPRLPASGILVEHPGRDDRAEDDAGLVDGVGS